MTDKLNFYFDTHIANAVSDQLRLRGVEVVRCEDVGMADASDLEHLEYATAKGLAVVSHDQDFLILDAQWQDKGRSHAGIFHIQPWLQGSTGQIVKELFSYYEMIKEGAGSIEADITNQVLFIG